VQAIQAAIDGLALNRRHALVFALCGAGLFFESLNLQLMSFVAPMLAREWRIGPALMGAAISAAIFGMLAGTYLFGALADRIGRRPAFQLTVGIFSALTALAGISASFWQLAAARFGAGLGIGGSIPVETAVLAEFTPGRWRGRLMALWAMALPLGAFLAPFCVAAMPAALGWRGLLFLGGAPAVLVLLLRRTIPETPAYLAGRGRTAEAMQALRWIAGRAVSVPAAPTDAPARVVAARIPPERLLFAEGYRESTIMSWLLYFGSFFAYYGFVLWLPALLAGYRGLERAEVLRFVATVAAAGFVGRAGVLLLADRVPKPTLIMGCSMLGSAALAAFALQTGHTAMLAWACAAAFCLEGTFSVLIPFVADLYPAQARATGVGWAGGAGRVAMALAPLAIGSLVEADVRLSILLLAGASLSVAAVILAFRGGSARP
jgi:putative MFS transporter